MQVPVLLYDWVSPKGFTRYLENETLAEQTVDGFLSSLRTAKRVLGAKDMTLLPHGMGALILVHHSIDVLLVVRPVPWGLSSQALSVFSQRLPVRIASPDL